MYSLTYGPKREPYYSFRICWSRKCHKYRKSFRERCEVGDATLNSMTLDDLPDIEAVLKNPLTKLIRFSDYECGAKTRNVGAGEHGD